MISHKFIIEFFIDTLVGDCSLGHSLSLLWILDHYSFVNYGIHTPRQLGGLFGNDLVEQSCDLILVFQ